MYSSIVFIVNCCLFEESKEGNKNTVLTSTKIIKVDIF